MKDWFVKFWKENKTFLVFVFLMFVFRSAVADWNDVPTGSMKPTIIEGDRILVDKLAYDIRIPFTHISLYRLSDPNCGDIVIFDSNIKNERLVKRVIGMPGDVVELKDNILFINGKELSYKLVFSNENYSDILENLFGIKHKIRVKNNHSPYSSFLPVKVPDGNYLVLGDNRDNSADSRFIGFIPRDEIIGRSRSVILSLNYNNYYVPRSNRVFHNL